ncbi:hypothetical protein RO575_05890 [Methylomonas sp. MO1]|uniref:hypothetical protein n=1 Tax=Methylomonas sp. MO1 TaxID=3073619 RepID=UPI0028A351E1|nr:hypothetical protein [Methylomonas sp. MO1]MDT4289078.1 hypothetical protein [Methylomonas sp. MO1]
MRASEYTSWRRSISVRYGFQSNQGLSVTASYFHYWGKAKPEADDGPVYHCVDVVVEWKLFKLLTGNDGSLKLRISTLCGLRRSLLSVNNRAES